MNSRRNLDICLGGDSCDGIDATVVNFGAFGFCNLPLVSVRLQFLSSAVINLALIISSTVTVTFASTILICLIPTNVFKERSTTGEAADPLIQR